MTIVFLWMSVTLAATIENIRVFAGTEHARILLIADGPIMGINTRSSPPTANAPARGTVILRRTIASNAVPPLIPVGEKGIEQIHITAVGESLQVTVEMTEPRSVRAVPLGNGSVLVDLMVEGGRGDPDLPTAEHLKDWLEGVSLVRAAGGPPREHRVVVVDPGHGGFDHGAVGTTGTREADVALEIARRTARGLEDQLGVTVILTRDEDIFIPLRERAALANMENADLFLSIHANAAPTSNPWGIETYSLDTASDASAARVASRENAMARNWSEEADPVLGRLLAAGTDRLSADLSAEVQKTVIQRLQMTYGTSNVRDLGTKTALFYVLVSTRMPAILFESSFVSHPQDERRLRTAHFQQTLADAIVEAVGRWLARQE